MSKEETKLALQRIHEYALEEIMGERFGRYAKEIIQDRAIPDVRDGLKPVQRRILYGMYKGRNTYENKYRKSARAVGDIMGKYHPHGDSSIYDAMVRMSQDWKMMTPYIDMHGNNGSMDGDSAAAMRYTEVKLSKIAGEILKDIDKDTVEMAPNYDDTEEEPTVLPCKFPNLLVNGTTGISAGYATDIPPHNLNEIIDATILRIDKPKCSLDDILEVVKGPDFPTGGIVEGKKGIREALETGKGKVVVKSKYHFEEKKGKNEIVITEIPYEVNKAALVKKMNDIRIEKKIDGIVDVVDSSSRGELIINITLKKDANRELILNYLLKNTDMQINYSYNMVAIVDRRPKQVGIIDILDAYINHQREVFTRRTKFHLKTAQKKFHITEGLVKAISILDEVIKLIRSSKNRDDATKNLMEKYDFSFDQADAIVKLQLYRLTNTDVLTLQKELEELRKAMEFLNAILSDEKKLMSLIKKELKEIKKEYGMDRKSEIKDEVTEIKIDMTAMIPKEDVVVVVTNEGYVKRVSKRSYSSSNMDDLTLKENDYVTGLYEMNTLDTVILFTNLGNYLYVPVYELPDLKWKDLGKHISNIIIIKPEEKIIGSVPVFDFNSGVITLFTKNGMIKRTSTSEFKVSRYTKPMVAMKLKDDDELVSVSSLNKKEVLISTKNGYGLWFGINEVSLTGVKSAGVKAIKLSDDEVVNGSLFSTDDEYITIFTDKMTAKRVKLSDIEKSSRARKGLLLIREVKTNPHKIKKVFITNQKEKFALINLKETVSIKNTEIPINDRYSTGSNISKIKLIDIYDQKELLSKESVDNYIEVLEEEKKDVSLKEIDDKMLTIDDFLDDFTEFKK